MVADTDSQTSGWCCADVGRDGPLADGGRSGEDGEAGRTPVTTAPNRSRSEATWFWPRPRTRRLSEMPTSSMIWRARTRPTPGMDSSRAETRILPMTSLALALGDDLGEGDAASASGGA